MVIHVSTMQHYVIGCIVTGDLKGCIVLWLPNPDPDPSGTNFSPSAATLFNIDIVENFTH
jgi:hypothetical protein